MKIRLENVVKTFDTFRAVRDVSLDIESGELLALLGPSGSGKTTILRMVAGLEYSDGGRIFFGDEDATNIPVRDRGVGFVFQHYALFPHMTLHENIAFGMKVSKVKRDKAAIDARVKELLNLVKLDGLGDRFPAQISGGQRQRVALARALSVDPKVLLLDEPFGALDANVRRDLRRWLREIHDSLGITTIFVTHDQEEALDLADRRQPNSSFVMRFLGDANRVSGVARGGKVYVGENELPFSYAQGDGAVDIYARPGDLEWEDLHEGVPASVERVLDRAGERRVIASTDGGDILEFDVPPENDVTAGDRGSVIIRRAKIFPVA